MKKQVILMAAAAAVVMPMVADAAGVLGAGAGATIDVCANGVFQTNSMNTDTALSTQEYLKKNFKVACSNNVDMAASETNIWLAVATASRKGKYVMGGNTEGSSPSCLKVAATDTRCDETTTSLVNPTDATKHQKLVRDNAASGAASTTAKFSPCFTVTPTPSGC